MNTLADRTSVAYILHASSFALAEDPCSLADPLTRTDSRHMAYETAIARRLDKTLAAAGDRSVTVEHIGQDSVARTEMVRWIRTRRSALLLALHFCYCPVEIFRSPPFLFYHLHSAPFFAVTLSDPSVAAEVV